jgi:hypothetical protein
MIHGIHERRDLWQALVVGNQPLSDEQIRSTIETLRASARQLVAEASTLIEKAAKLEDSFVRSEARVEFKADPSKARDMDGNH